MKTVYDHPIATGRYDSPIGSLQIEWAESGAITRIGFGSRARPLARTHPLARALDGYFAGRSVLDQLDVQLDVTPFQRKVLEAARRIPAGEVRTYGWVARRIGRPQAARAVGQALGANPVPVVIPCHRVVASAGEGGYGGGLGRKRRLLALEEKFSRKARL